MSALDKACSVAGEYHAVDREHQENVTSAFTTLAYCSLGTQYCIGSSLSRWMISEVA